MCVGWGVTGSQGHLVTMEKKLAVGKSSSGLGYPLKHSRRTGQIGAYT